jgi:regulator of RNase E activity RraB
MATRITVLKNPNGQFTGWMCKHSSKTEQNAECDGHVVLCERCASAVGNGAQLLDDQNRQLVEPVKVTVSALVQRAAVGR